MENYNNYASSYPESGDSSPHSREIDFENPPPWEDQNQPQPQNYKVKFMCSYGGKIHPRPHDNQLAYVGGETKILAVDRGIKFSSMMSKLLALCDLDGITFKYQLPGEDLDALISVTNDDDLEHMMHEFDRLYRASPKPARLRLFLFPINSSVCGTRSFGSDEGRSEKERFVDALNSGTPPPPASVAPPQNNNVDFLFGLDKGLPSAPPQAAVAPPQNQMKIEVNEAEVQVPVIEDPIQKHIQDLQRIRLEEQQGLYRKKSDDNLSGGYSGGDYYVQKLQEKGVQMPGPGQIPSGYWPEKQIPGGVYHGGGTTPAGDQQYYVMPQPAPGGGAYHPQVVRPHPGVNQGYYAVSRMPPEVYNTSLPPPVSAVPPRVSPAGMGMVDGGQYPQMVYDSGVGRQVYYNVPGGQVMSGQTPPPPGIGGSAPQYQAVAAAADMKLVGGGFNHDGGKGGPKATQALV